jgi:hypothetical protein
VVPFFTDNQFRIYTSLLFSAADVYITQLKLQKSRNFAENASIVATVKYQSLNREIPFVAQINADKYESISWPYTRPHK